LEGAYSAPPDPIYNCIRGDLLLKRKRGMRREGRREVKLRDGKGRDGKFAPPIGDSGSGSG